MSTPKEYQDGDGHGSLAGMGLPDPSGTRIVLIGAGRFSELHELPATRRNVKRLAGLLTRAWRLPVANCTVLRDPASPRDLSRVVEEAAREATDTLLVYYAGHGLIDRAGHYYLAVQSSESASVHDTAVPYRWIREHVARSRAERRIIILDCCYAARAFGLQSDSAAVGVDGTHILAAAGETSAAISPPGEEFTAFTGALLTVLTNGVPGRPRHLSLDDIFEQLSKELSGRPRPRQLVSDHAPRAPFIANAAHEQPGGTPVPVVPVQRTRTTKPHSGKAANPSALSGSGTPAPAGKPAPAPRRKAVRRAGIALASTILLFAGWTVHTLNFVDPDDSPQIREMKSSGLVVGAKGDQPGLSWEEDGSWKGFEVDLARDVAVELGFKRGDVEFSRVTTANRPTDLENEDVDLVFATWSMKGKQAKQAQERGQADFVGPYFKAGAALLVTTNSDSKPFFWINGDWVGPEKNITSVRDIPSGVSICTVKGSTSKETLDQLLADADSAKKITTVEKTGYLDCLDKLENEEPSPIFTDDIILAGLHDKGTDDGWDLKVYFLDEGSSESHAVAMPPGDPVLKYLTCEALRKEKESRRWDQLYAKHLAGPVHSAMSSERRFLPAAPEECNAWEVWRYKLTKMDFF